MGWKKKLKGWLAGLFARWSRKLAPPETRPLEPGQWDEVDEHLGSAIKALQNATKQMGKADDKPATNFKRDLAVVKGLAVDLIAQVHLLRLRGDVTFRGDSNADATQEPTKSADAVRATPGPQ